jgi:hypothetical protein
LKKGRKEKREERREKREERRVANIQRAIKAEESCWREDIVKMLIWFVS